MVDFPLELWLDIAQYLPSSTLKKLFKVNRPLFNISMDLRWREVTFETRNLDKAMRLLERLSDPFIARKLKSLVIIFNEHAGTKTPSWKIVPEIPRESKNLVVRHLLSLQSAIFHSREATFIGFGTELISRVPTFTNVTELTIDCWDPLHYDLSSLYESFWWAFGDNLVSLTLKGYLESHASVISPSPALGSTLKHLRIDFGLNIFVSRPDTNRNHQILVNDIAPFVKSLSPQLEGLSIRCWAGLDMSPFFAVCNDFPRLRYLAVRMGFSRIWQDTSGLQSLLHSSGKRLRRLEMRLNRPYFDMHMRTGMNTGMDVELRDWLLERLTDEQCMSQVCELDLYPTRTCRGLGIVVASVERGSATLEKLTIRDWYLNRTEVATFIDALSTCQKLRYLRMNLVCLDIDVLDFMAAHLPNLKGLSLSLEGSANGYMFRYFLPELPERRYDQWKLVDLSLWQGRVKVRMDEMRKFSEAIPSIESFFERGRKL